METHNLTIDFGEAGRVGAEDSGDSLYEKKWNAAFARLKAFKAKHGHCRVPNRCAEDPQLGNWVSTQRRQYRILTTGLNKTVPLTQERAQQLVALGFEWSAKDPSHKCWEDRFQELCDYKRKHGSTLVPMGWKENPRLATWVSTQRQEYKQLKLGHSSRLNEAKVKLLNEIGFVWEAQRGRRKLPNPMELSNSDDVLLDLARKAEGAQIPATLTRCLGTLAIATKEQDLMALIGLMQGKQGVEALASLVSGSDDKGQALAHTFGRASTREGSATGANSASDMATLFAALTGINNSSVQAGEASSCMQNGRDTARDLLSDAVFSGNHDENDNRSLSQALVESQAAVKEIRTPDLAKLLLSSQNRSKAKGQDLIKKENELGGFLGPAASLILPTPTVGQSSQHAQRSAALLIDPQASVEEAKRTCDPNRQQPDQFGQFLAAVGKKDSGSSFALAPTTKRKRCLEEMLGEAELVQALTDPKKRQQIQDSLSCPVTDQSRPSVPDTGSAPLVVSGDNKLETQAALDMVHLYAVSLPASSSVRVALLTTPSVDEAQSILKADIACNNLNLGTSGLSSHSSPASQGLRTVMPLVSAAQPQRATLLDTLRGLLPLNPLPVTMNPRVPIPQTSTPSLALQLQLLAGKCGLVGPGVDNNPIGQSLEDLFQPQSAVTMDGADGKTPFEENGCNP